MPYTAKLKCMEVLEYACFQLVMFVFAYILLYQWLMTVFTMLIVFVKHIVYVYIFLFHRFRHAAVSAMMGSRKIAGSAVHSKAPRLAEIVTRVKNLSDAAKSGFPPEGKSCRFYKAIEISILCTFVIFACIHTYIHIYCTYIHIYCTYIHIYCTCLVECIVYFIVAK